MSRYATAGALSAAASAALLLAAAAPVQAAEVTPEFTVTVVSANGSGCPGTAATARILPDGTSFSIDYSGYLAWTGGGAPPTAFRRNCQFNLAITRPAGVTYTIEHAEYTGFALLDDGVTGLQANRYYFQGQSATTAASHEFAGPLADTWQTTDYPESLGFAPCGTERNLNVNTELRLLPLPASADLNVMVMDPSLTVHLAWRACSSG